MLIKIHRLLQTSGRLDPVTHYQQHHISYRLFK